MAREEYATGEDWVPLNLDFALGKWSPGRIAKTLCGELVKTGN